MKTALDVITYIGDKANRTWAKLLDGNISKEERVKYKKEYNILVDLYLELHSEFGYTEGVLNMIDTTEFKDYFKKFTEQSFKNMLNYKNKGEV